MMRGLLLPKENRKKKKEKNRIEKEKKKKRIEGGSPEAQGGIETRIETQERVSKWRHHRMTVLQRREQADRILFLPLLPLLLVPLVLPHWYCQVGDSPLRWKVEVAELTCSRNEERRKEGGKKKVPVIQKWP